MTVDECIGAYINSMRVMHKLNSSLWILKSMLGSENAIKFDSKALEASIKEITKQRGLNPACLFVEEHPSCRVWVR